MDDHDWRQKPADRPLIWSAASDAAGSGLAMETTCDTKLTEASIL
jgi:hypothetical protein